MDGFFFLFLMGIVGIIILYSSLYGITPTPTSAKVTKHLIHMLPQLENVEIVELGSGWGTLAFALARNFPLCRITCYEISPIPYLVSKLIAYWYDFPNLSIKREDFFQVSLKGVSLAVCYLYPDAMVKLKQKFETELSTNAYVISHTFAVPGWVPKRFEKANDLYLTPIYLYKIEIENSR